MKKERPTEAVLVIVLAETRAHEHTFDLFKRNVLDNFGADLCLCVADNEREDLDNPFYRHASHVWRYPEPDDWGQAFDEAQRRSGCDVEWRGLLEVGRQWLGGIRGEGQQPGSAAILLFFRWFLKERLLATGTIDRYDRFVVTRSDFVHRIPHTPLELLSRDHIWIPLGEDYGGYTDRHIIASRRDILDVLSITDAILSDPLNLAHAMQHSAGWNLERYIKFSFARMGLARKVRRYPYTMYAVRGVGGRTRWALGRFDEALGYFIKYPGEYERFRLARRLIRGRSDWSAAKIVLLNGLVTIRTFVRRMLKPPRLLASAVWTGTRRLFAADG
jgi:hypothetical protein